MKNMKKISTILVMIFAFFVLLSTEAVARPTSITMIFEDGASIVTMDTSVQAGYYYEDFFNDFFPKVGIFPYGDIVLHGMLAEEFEKALIAYFSELYAEQLRDYEYIIIDETNDWEIESWRMFIEEHELDIIVLDKSGNELLIQPFSVPVRREQFFNTSRGEAGINVDVVLAGGMYHYQPNTVSPFTRNYSLGHSSGSHRVTSRSTHSITVSFEFRFGQAAVGGGLHNVEEMKSLQTECEAYLSNNKDNKHKHIENTVHILNALIDYNLNDNRKSAYDKVLPMLENLEFGEKVGLFESPYDRIIFMTSKEI